MAKVKVLKENELIGGTDNSSVYPITHTKAIFDSNNKELDQRLNENDTDRNLLHQKSKEIVDSFKILNNRVDNFEEDIIEQYKNIKDFKEVITDQVNNYKPIIINGNVNNAADEEDLHADSKTGLISLANRSTLNGMGYIILRKNKSFAEQVTKENTIYEIRYNFNLNGSAFSIPNNCILKFEGGTISNGVLTGHVLNEYINPKWLGAKGDGTTDDTIAIRNAIDICTKVVIPAGDYKITAQDKHVKEGYRNAIWINTSNHYIKCEEGAVFHLSYSVAPAVGYNSLWGYFMGIAGTKDSYVENIVIEGGTWIGGRSLFPATPADKRIEEGSSAFFLTYTRNVTFKDCIITDNQGDSITIYNTEDFKAINVTSRYARRSGIAFGSSRRCLIENSHFVEDAADKYYGDILSKGTAPYFAIEVDNDGVTPCENMIFRNNIFECTISPKGALLIVDEKSPIQDVIFEGNIIHSKTSNYVWGVEITSLKLVKNIQIINNRFYNSSGLRHDSTINLVTINSDCKINELNISGNYIENGNILYWYAKDSTSARDTFNINIDNNVSYSGVLLSGYPDAKTLNIRNNILQSATILNTVASSSYTTGIIRKILIQNNVTNVTEQPLSSMVIYINFKSNAGTESFDIIGNTIKSSTPTTLYLSQFSKAVTYPVRFIGNKLDFKNGDFKLNQWSTFPGMLAQNVFIFKKDVTLTYSNEMAAPMKIINNIFEGSTVPFVSEEHNDIIVQGNIFV